MRQIYKNHQMILLDYFLIFQNNTGCFEFFHNKLNLKIYKLNQMKFFLRLLSLKLVRKKGKYLSRLTVNSLLNFFH